MERLVLDGDTHLLVLTGAGVSAESGVQTFRGAGGLWEDHPVERVASPQGFAADPALVWRFYSQRRAQAGQVSPNPGHLALVAAERHLKDRFLLATQNVDGLHAAAGSERVAELHGNLFLTRCSRCDRAPFQDRTAYAAGQVPLCDRCGAPLRPHIVWFGEALDGAILRRIERFCAAASGHRFLFVAAGTSGAVWPAAGLVDLAAAAGATTVLVNLEPPENAGSFDVQLQGRSGELLPTLFDLR